MAEIVKPMIYKAIIDTMEDIGAVGKNQRNQQQGFMYRGIDAVMNAINPALTKNRLFIAPEILEQIREERVTAKGTNLIYSICKIKYTVYAEDGSHISVVTIGEGMDSGDKATNKAMAIAYKYACFQLFCIPTEEMVDPDAEVQDSSKRKSGTIKTEENKTSVTAKEKINLAKQRALSALLESNGILNDTICKLYKVNGLADLTEKQHNNIVKYIDDIKAKQEENK